MLSDFSFAVLGLGFFEFLLENFLVGLEVVLVLTVYLEHSGVQALGDELPIGLVSFLVICRDHLEHFCNVLV